MFATFRHSFLSKPIIFSRTRSKEIPLKFILFHGTLSKAKPLVLEKPTKFNPPSHGARLRNPAPRYTGPPLSAEESARQRIKKYPNMMPPPGTFMHWFLHSKLIHLWLSLGILSSLTIFVLITNYKRDSPFADMLPDWPNLFLHPIDSWGTVLEVIKLDAARTSAEAAEKRKQRIDDVSKRALYRKAHGLDQSESLGGWTAKNEIKALDVSTSVDNCDTNKSSSENGDTSEQNVGSDNQRTRDKKPLKKWLGIW